MKTRKYQLVELIKAASIVGAGQRLFFTDQPQLRSDQGKTVQILAMEAYSVETVPVAPSGNVVSDQAAFQNAFLVLSVKGVENLLQIPLSRLNIMHVNTDTCPFTNFQFEFLDLSNVDWPKSYVQFATAPAGTQFSYLFGVYYNSNN